MSSDSATKKTALPVASGEMRPSSVPERSTTSTRTPLRLETAVPTEKMDLIWDRWYSTPQVILQLHLLLPHFIETCPQSRAAEHLYPAFLHTTTSHYDQYDQPPPRQCLNLTPQRRAPHQPLSQGGVGRCFGQGMSSHDLNNYLDH